MNASTVAFDAWITRDREVAVCQDRHARDERRVVVSSPDDPDLEWVRLRWNVPNRINDVGIGGNDSGPLPFRRGDQRIVLYVLQYPSLLRGSIPCEVGGFGIAGVIGS